MTATVFDPGLDLDPDLLSREERVEALLAADRLRSKAEALELRIIGSFDANGDFGFDGALNAPVWLARHLDMTRDTAGAMTRDAAKLRRYPLSMDACGHLGTAKVRELIRRVTPRIAEDFAEAEPLLLRTIRPLTVDDTIIFAKRWAMLVDQNGKEPPEQKQAITMGRTGDALHGSFTLYGEDAALLTDAIDHESDAIWRSEGEAGHLDPGPRRAEALMNLIRKAVGASQTTDPAKPAFIIHMTLDQLERRAAWHPAEIDPFGPLSTLAVQRLLCDADIHRNLIRPNSATLDFGRAQRLVKGLQRLALIARDRHCTFPGCDRPPAMCHAHHIEPWETGGATNLANLTLLCHRHHHTIHEDSFTVARLHYGHLQYRRPDNTIIHPQPRPG